MTNRRTSFAIITMAPAFILLLAFGAPVLAQDASGNSASNVLEEVLVTAQRREERLLEVPISITSITGDQIDAASVVGLFDLKTVVPGVRVDHYGAYSQPTIRGVGTQDVLGPGANANVAIYMDGFYMPSQTGNLFEFGNVERVDVLKGPQGTLFGQNATGGAILIKTFDPDFESWGHIRAGIGSFDDRYGSIYGTTGVTDKIAVNWSLYYRDSDNYFDDVALGKPSSPTHNRAFSTKILFENSEDSRWIASLLYQDFNNPTGLSENTFNPIAAFYHDVYGVPMINSLEPYTTSFNSQALANPKVWGATLTGEMRFGDYEFRSYTQYRDQDADIRADLDGTTVQYWQVEYNETEETFTQEFSIGQSGVGRLDWVAGLYYYYNEGYLRNNAYNDVFNTGTRTSWLSSDATVTTRSIAGFADGVYELADTWWLTVGMRYTSEKKSLYSVNLLSPFNEFRDSERWNEFTPRVVIRHEPTPNSSIYGSISQGFMSGNYSYNTTGPQAPVNPEQITMYEVGYKAGADRWSFDTAAYLSDYKDLQVFLFDNDCVCFHLDNAPKAEIYGWEGYLTYEATEHLDLTAGVAYTHARYEEYVGVGIPGGPYIPPNYGFATAPADFSGKQMLRTPEWTTSIAFNYLHPVGAGSVNLSGNYFWSDDVPLTPGNEFWQESYGLLSLRAGWIAAEGRWSVYAYGTNVTDEEYLIFSTAGFLGNNFIYGAPAAWGLQFNFKY